MAVFSFRNFFSDNMRVRIIIFYVAQSAKFLGYMTKSLNQIFFPPPETKYFFQQHWES